MFQLVIEHQGGVDVTTHPSREVTLGELVAFLNGIGCDYRVIQATWEHSSYDLVTQHHLATAHDVSPPVCGHAVIEEICACGHTERDHDDAGCTFLKRWLLVDGVRARQMLRFLSSPLWRAYISTYVEGYRLLRGWLDAAPAGVSVVSRFTRLLDEPLIPSTLRFHTGHADSSYETTESAEIRES